MMNVSDPGYGVSVFDGYNGPRYIVTCFHCSTFKRKCATSAGAYVLGEAHLREAHRDK